MKKIIVLPALLLLVLTISYAQPGKIDSLFGNKGIVTTDMGKSITHSGLSRQVLLNADGSMYIIIETDHKTIIAKKQANGSPDLTYGHNGFSVEIGILGARAAIEADGKIVIAGRKYADFYATYAGSLARINPDGSLDKSFGGGVGVIDGRIGYYYEAFNSLVIDNDGSITIAGFSASDGNGDFDGNGTLANPNGYITLARYNSSGSLVPPYDNQQKDITGFHTNTATDNLIALQTDGKIIIAASGDSGLNLARYNPDGNLDNTFKVSGPLKINGSTYFAAKSLAIQNDGKIVIGGSWQNNPSDFVVVGYNIDGRSDSTFSNDGVQATDFNTYDDVITSITIQNDNKILAAGYASNGSRVGFAITRYKYNGSLDSTFNGTGKKITFIDPSDIYGNSLALQANGKFVIAGYSNANNITVVKMAKYKTDGSMDSSFGSKGTLTDSLKQPRTIFNSTAIAPDHKIITAGYAWNGVNYDFAVARYLTDGRLDNTFSSDGLQTTDFGSDDFANSVAIQPDGKIIVAGKVLVRYNTDGSLDNTFNGSGKKTSDFEIFFVKLQTDGKIIVAGGQNVARYNSNGSLDVSFNHTGKINTIDIRDIALQKDGKIVLVNGSFEIRRYNTDGSFDMGSDAGKLALRNLFQSDLDDGYYDNIFQISNSLAIQSDGKIVVGGNAGGDARNGYFLNATVVRYHINGSLDSTFSGSGIKIISLDNNTINTMQSSIAIEKDDKLVVKSVTYYNGDGYDTYEVVPSGYVFNRLNTDGNIDHSFSTGGSQYAGLDNTLTSMAIDDDKLYVAGYGKHLTEYGFLSRYLLALNKTPVVSLTAPANNAIYTAPATFTLNASASDQDGIITSVQFYNGSTLLKADSTSPYSFTISNLTPGNYSFVAKATDNNGLSNNSATIAVSVITAPNKGPVVNITNPVTNAAYIAPATITINAAASDPDGIITDIKFFNGSTLIAVDSTSPYSCTIFNAVPGTYKFYAQATDNSGLKNASSSVTAFVVSPSANSAPTVSITSPVNNANYPAVATIVLHAAASDADGTITSVQFYNGSTLLKTDNSSPYSCTISHPPAGNYTFVAKAIDNNGLTNNSATVTVSVGGTTNKSPTVNLTLPANNASYAAPATITLNAAASDADGNIKVVQFYNGSTLLKTDSVSPYTYTIDDAAAGNYRFYAKAIDNSGLTNSSTTVSVFVLPGVSNKAPVVQLINPANNTIHYAPGTIYMNAVAGDEDGTIANVKFYMGSTLLSTDSIPPYVYTVTDLPVGNYTFTAKATDNKSLESNSATAVVPVLAAPNKAPVISLTTPLNNETDTTPATITLNATASDPDGTITNVKFFNGATLLKTVNTAPYSYTINDAAMGSYKFFAKATDNKGFSSSSSTVTVFVQEGPLLPCAASSQPTFGFNFNGTLVANINNRVPDPGESASLTGCGIVQYFTSGHFSSSQSDLYNITVTSSGGTLFFDGNEAGNGVITASQLSGSAGAHTMQPADPNVGGSLTQTITPFTDLDNNGVLDAGDCAGDPIVFTYTDSPCSGISARASGIASGIDRKFTMPVAESVKLAPNPAHNILNINTSGLQWDKRSTITVISASGMIMKTIRSTGSNQTIQLNISSFTSGAYIVKIVSGDKVMYKQFVKM